ncbi:hypothetical protein I656_02849 [Geobacillus sp. WSUCF1]|nr:hypothetical protein I656_02849 [Geobacillus sp. WSUCF1]
MRKLPSHPTECQGSWMDRQERLGVGDTTINKVKQCNEAGRKKDRVHVSFFPPFCLYFR